jgi:hypothetical protein
MNQKQIMVLIAIFAAIIGVFLIPTVALAKKSHHQSSDDGDISSSSSPPSTTTGPINDGGSSAGWRDGQSQVLVDERSGIDNDNCGTEHSNLYCVGYKAGYDAEHVPFNALHL